MKAPLEFSAKGFKVIVSCRELGGIGVGRAVPEDRVSKGGRGGLTILYIGTCYIIWAVELSVDHPLNKPLPCQAPHWLRGL